MRITATTRILILSAIATGLATALVVHGTSKGRYIPTRWRGADAAVEVGAAGSQSGLPSPLQLVPKERPTPSSAYDAAFFDGGDAGDAPTPPPEVATFTPTSDASNADTPTPAIDAGDPRRIFSDASVQASPTADLDFMVGTNSRSSSGGLIYPTPVRTPSSDLPWVSGQARGYAMLYAMQPEARAVTEANISALLASHVRQPYIGVLMDGTFSRDFTYLEDIISRLSSGGRRLTLALYLANGATQRKPGTLIEAPFVRENPILFRNLIRRTGGQLQLQYTQLARDARAIFEFSLETNPENTNIAIVMLEDNLDTEAYRVMLNLAKEELDGFATIYRNPCVGCEVAGSDDETLGQPREEHKISRFGLLQSGDGFTLDGTGFEYPNGPQSTALSAQRLESLLQNGYKKGLAYFGLWRYGWQGLIEGQGNPLPSNRVYVPSSPEEIEYEITVLRTGLPPDTEDEPSGEDGEEIDDTVRIFESK
jgi:hypothetical protein